jgi:hypothetical protein
VPDRKLVRFDAVFWTLFAGAMWLLTCIDGIIEGLLYSSAYAWVGLLLSSTAVTAIAAGYVVKAFRR